MHPDLTPDQLAGRRELMIRILEDMKRGISCIVPFVAPPRETHKRFERHVGGQVGNQCARRQTEEMLEGRFRKATCLLRAIAAENRDKAKHWLLRQQYYTLKNEIKRFCTARGLEIPVLPLAPISPFANACPRMRSLPK